MRPSRTQPTTPRPTSHHVILARAAPALGPPWHLSPSVGQLLLSLCWTDPSSRKPHGFFCLLCASTTTLFHSTNPLVYPLSLPPCFSSRTFQHMTSLDCVFCCLPLGLQGFLSVLLTSTFPAQESGTWLGLHKYLLTKVVFEWPPSGSWKETGDSCGTRLCPAQLWRPWLTGASH